MINFAEYDATGNASFFKHLCFEYWQEPTTDSVRKVRWLYRFRAFDPADNSSDESTVPFLLVLAVDYELSIDDAPDVPSSANFNYYFEGVRLELRDTRTDEPLGTFRLKISTDDELKTFLSTFPNHPHSRKRS